MSKKNDGKSYEDFVASLYDSLIVKNFGTVERDVRVNGPDGYRQIDILIKTAIASHENIMVIECKDYGKKVDVTAVDKLDSLYKDVGAHQAILVSRSGFSRTAIQKAKRKSIELIQAMDASDVVRIIKPKYPVVINEHRLNRYEIRCTIDAKVSGLSYQFLIEYLHKSISEACKVIFGGNTERHLLNGMANAEAGGELALILKIDEIRMHHKGSEILIVEDLEFLCGIDVFYWYSLMDEFLPSAMRVNSLTGKEFFHYTVDDIKRMGHKLQRAKNNEEIPFKNEQAVRINILSSSEDDIFEKISSLLGSKIAN